MRLARVTCSNPPIVEVVCGVVFEPIAGLDALDWGTYWLERREEYPIKQLHHAVLEPGAGPLFTLGSALPPARAWMMSNDKRYLVQIQHDRLYVNWKSSPDSYPRFRGTEKGEGLRARSLREYERYSKFVLERTGLQTSPLRVEVQKVNVLHRGEGPGQWKELQDLRAYLLPLQGLPLADESTGLSIEIAQTAHYEWGTIVMRASSQGPALPISFRLDIQGRETMLDANMEAAFDHLNDRVNHTFEGVLSDSARVAFGLETEDADDV